MSWLDLHMHSKYSADGEFTPGELISACLRAGVRTAAIADHNSTRGVKEGLAFAARSGVTLIPAVELDCTFQGTGLHLLGYYIDPAHPDFERVERDVLEQEQAAAQKRIELVCALGIHVNAIEIQRLSENGIVTGELIAEVALAQKENDGNPLLAPYRAGGARGDNPLVNFYWDFCAQGKPAYVPVRFLELSDAVSLVRAAGGVPVLAHPACNLGENTALFREIIQQDVAGVEAYSSYHSPAQTALYLALAKELGLAVTCGSDFHGKVKPKIQPGGVDCEQMEQELLAELVKRRREGSSCKE